jgi:hypothetical protein
VVYPNCGSSESGAVPITKVIVPDLPPLEVLPPEPADDDDDELEELPHAASATVVPSASKPVKIDLVFLLIKVLLLRGLRSWPRNLLDPNERVGRLRQP